MSAPERVSASPVAGFAATLPAMRESDSSPLPVLMIRNGILSTPLPGYMALRPDRWRIVVDSTTMRQRVPLVKLPGPDDAANAAPLAQAATRSHVVVIGPFQLTFN